MFRRERHDSSWGTRQTGSIYGNKDNAINESTVETAAQNWLEATGWRVVQGADIDPGASGAERTDYDPGRPGSTPSKLPLGTQSGPSLTFVPM